MSDMALAELRPRKITVDDYHRMAEAEILRAGERVELLDGIIVEMSPIGWPHRALHALIVEYLIQTLADRATVFGQFSWPLGEYDEPEPDIGVFARESTAYFERDLTPAEAFAIVEIAGSSLSRDVGPKRDLYARFGIPDYLVVDVVSQELLHFTGPADGCYAKLRRHSYGGAFHLSALPGINLNVDRFLPPR